ncbi:MAG: hypothetical protein HQL40_02185 [Alphaproteobacteria bacterium]|nr:hypothetical protein [Alphaproteobacteria bacterium]
MSELPAIGRHAAAYLGEADTRLGEEFLERGRVVLPVDDPAGLARIRQAAAGLAAAHLGLAAPEAGAEGDFLDFIHRHVQPSDLNALRLAVIEGLNAQPWLRPVYHGLARRALDAIVGNELAMQRRVNLSIQLPGDADSLLPIHADCWSGDSPYEVVAWLPLVDCRATKSMYLTPPAAALRLAARFADLPSAEALFRAVEAEVEWLEVPFGSVLLFSQNLPHGNRPNREAETRWSLNCRFKAVFTPYADKKPGEFFDPITLRPASRLGLAHRFPEVGR